MALRPAEFDISNPAREGLSSILLSSRSQADKTDDTNKTILSSYNPKSNLTAEIEKYAYINGNWFLHC